MTREQIAAALSAIQRRLDNRIVIVRVVVTGDGREVGRIVRSSATTKGTS